MLVIDMEARPIADSWVEGALPYRIAAEPLVVPMAALAELSAGEVQEVAPIGVRIALGAESDRVLALVDHLELIVIEFPSFRDGRGFTLATTLRTKYRYKGDLRAAGNILPDQFLALRACGFSTIETSAAHPPEQWQRGMAGSGAAERLTEPLVKRLLNQGNARSHEDLDRVDGQDVLSG